MKKLKNLVAAVLLAVFSTVCFSACSNKDNSGTGGSTPPPTPQKTKQELAVESLTAAQTNLLGDKKFKQTFSSKVVYADDTEVTAEHDGAVYGEGIVSVTTNLEETAEINYFVMSDSLKNYFESYEVSGDNYVRKVYDQSTMKYRSEYLTKENKLSKIYNETRIDCGILDIIEMFEADTANQYVHAYDFKEENNLETVTYTRTKENAEILTLTITIQNGKFTSFERKTQDLVLDQTVTISSVITYENCDLELDIDDYLENSFNALSYLSNIIDTVELGELKNQVVNTEVATEGNEESEKYTTKYANDYGNEKLLFTKEGVQKPLAYYDSRRISEDDFYAKLKDYDFDANTYVETKVTYEDFLSIYAETDVDYALIKELYVIANDSSDYTFTIKMVDGIYVYTLEATEDAIEQGVDFTKLVLNIDDDSLVSAIRVSGDVTTTYTYSYEIVEIVLDTTGFVEVVE